MRSDEIKIPEPEKFTDNAGNKARFFAYLKALSGKDRQKVRTKDDHGMSGLMKELEKTRLDTCDNA